MSGSPGFASEPRGWTAGSALANCRAGRRPSTDAVGRTRHGGFGKKRQFPVQAVSLLTGRPSPLETLSFYFLRLAPPPVRLHPAAASPVS